MPYQKVENWKYGLDARRSELTSQPGTLQSLVNGHINQGGEIEKRKAFFAQALPTGTGYTFGMQPTANGITVFGSAAAPGGFPITFTDTQGGTIIFYQQLKHPTDILNGTTNTVPMTAIVWSTAFSGKTWAVAKFNDGNVYAYYDGALVKDFTNGLVLASLNTNTKIATEMAAEINATTSYTATHSTNTFDSFSLPPATYNVAKTVTSASGTLSSSTVSTGSAAVPAVAAVGQFSVINGTANPGVNKVLSIKVNGVDILGSAVNFTTNPNRTASALAVVINAFQANYVASVSQNVVTIKALASAGATPNGYVVQVNVAGNICIDQCIASFSIASTGGTFNVTSVLAGGVDLLAGTPVAWTTDLPTTIAAVATSIVTNGVSGGSPTGYTAVAVGSVLYISRLSPDSTSPAVAVTVVLSANGGVTGGTGNPLLVQLSVNNISFSGTQNTINTSSAVTAVATGGVPPYYYNWGYIGGSFSNPLITSAQGNPNLLYPNNQYGATTTFSNYYIDGRFNPNLLNNQYQCTVTDSLGATAISTTLSVTYSQQS